MMGIPAAGPGRPAGASDQPALVDPGAVDPPAPERVGGIDDMEQDHPADAGDLPDALQGPGGTGREIGGEEDRVKERLGFHLLPGFSPASLNLLMHRGWAAGQ